MYWLSFVRIGVAATCLLVWQSLYGQQIIEQQTIQSVKKTVSCGEYFLTKINAWWLEMNTFFNDPFFIFQDCDGVDQTVFIWCGCGETGYRIEKYGNVFFENEEDHPELDKIIQLIEQWVQHDALYSIQRPSVWWYETVYKIDCL